MNKIALLIISLSIFLASCDPLTPYLIKNRKKLTGSSTGANDFFGGEKVGGLPSVVINPKEKPGENPKGKQNKNQNGNKNGNQNGNQNENEGGSVTKKRLSGTALNGGNSSHNFDLKFKLVDNENHKFYFFADKNLENGVSLNISRNEQRVEVKLSLNGVTHSIDLELAESEEQVYLSVDIHNDHNDAHILIWDGAGPFGDSDDCIEDESCLYNTEYFTDPNPGPWGGQGKGAGTFWGHEGNSESVIFLSGPNEKKSDA